jgi:putative hydrolases of HD superfamily
MMFESLENKDLCACLEFIVKADALKKVLRKTRVIKNDRLENAAEHSWHLALMALVLQRYANAPINLERVIKMLLLHDLGEIEVGDFNLYDNARSEAQKSERVAIERLSSSLPQELYAEMMSLWTEFTEGITPEACYARALDRFQPFLSNLLNDGGSWKFLKITKEKALAKNQHIAEGSTTLWHAYEVLAEQAKMDGCFHKPA